MAHSRVHRQNGEHQRDIVDHRRQSADDDVGGHRPQAHIQNLRGQRQIPQHPQTADGKDDAKEKEQRVPFHPLHLGETVQHHILVTPPPAGQAQAVSQGLQIAQAQHHPHRRWQVQSVLEQNRGCNRRCKQRHHGPHPGLGAHAVVPHLGPPFGNGPNHNHRRQRPIDNRGDKKGEELKKPEFTLLPNHQGRDVAKGAKRPARIGRHHDRDAAHHGKLGTVPTQSRHHRAYHQGCGEVVEHRRQGKRQNARQDEKLPIAKPRPHQNPAQNVKGAAFFQRVDVGDGHDQEQEQLTVFFDHTKCGLMGKVGLSGQGKGHANQRPDQTRRQKHRLGFCHASNFFKNHQHIGQKEDAQRAKPCPMPRIIHPPSPFRTRLQGQCPKTPCRTLPACGPPCKPKPIERRR